MVVLRQSTLALDLVSTSFSTLGTQSFTLECFISLLTSVIWKRFLGDSEWDNIPTIIFFSALCVDTCNYFEFWLIHCIVCFPCGWLQWLLCFCFTTGSNENRSYQNLWLTQVYLLCRNSVELMAGAVSVSTMVLHPWIHKFHFSRDLVDWQEKSHGTQYGNGQRRWRFHAIRYEQESITRCLQLPHYAYVTAFLQTGLFLGLFSREIGRFWSRSVSVRENILFFFLIFRWNNDANSKFSLCLWLVTELPAWVWIRGKFKLKIDRSVKTPWLDHGVVASS